MVHIYEPLLCFTTFQTQHLMREQPKNVKSVNLVSELCNFMSVLFSNVDADNNNMALLCELLETLIEVVQGNTSNQVGGVGAFLLTLYCIMRGIMIVHCKFGSSTLRRTLGQG